MENLSKKGKQFVTSDGVTIHYQLKLHKKTQLTLVMLHGLASNGSRWHEFVANTQLHKYMNLLWLDLRGHGRSMTIGTINHEVWVRDIYGILRAEKLDQVLIAGHSLGAQLAIHFVLKHPAMVHGLVLIDPTLPAKLKGKLAVAKRFRFIVWLWIRMLLLCNKLMPKQTVYPQRDLHQLDLKTRELIAQHSDDIIASLYTSPKADLKYIPLVNYLQDIFAVTGALPDLSAIKCAMLVLLSKDSTIGSAGEIKTYLSGVSALELIEIEANHWPLTERPEETRLAIETWCLKQII